MKTVVTGASGYLGRNFASLYGDQIEIIALTRDTGHVADIPGAEWRETDYSPESLRRALEGCDAVVHLAYAMATKDNEQAGIEAYRSSMETSGNVFAAAMELGITNMVFASSRLVYPERSDEPFREDGPAVPRTYYGKSKLMTEKLCEELNGRGACIKVLRFGQIIGAGMKVKGMFRIFMEKALKNETLTLIGSDVRDYICVKDACGSIAAALGHPEAKGVYNISMGTGTDNRAMAEGVISACGSSSAIVTAETDTAKEPDRIVLDCSKARRDLGFSCKYGSIREIAADVLRETKK